MAPHAGLLGRHRVLQLLTLNGSVQMRNGIKASLLFLLVMTVIDGAAAQSSSNQPKASGMEADITKIKQAMLGNWESIAPEVRPSAAKNADGSLKPFYLKRSFKYLPSDRFELEIINSADPYGAVPLARIKIGGHMLWQGPHPIAPGAQKVDFVADESYEVTPLAQGFADILNKVAVDGYGAWAVNAPQSIFGKTFVPFGLKQGTNFMESRLSQGRSAVLGRPQYRRSRLRYRTKPSHQPADPDDPEVDL